MRSFLSLPLIAGFLLSARITVAAEPSVAEIFSDGMVLQRDMPITVWGNADDGTEVAVSFGGATATGTASGGKWKVELPAQTANAEPRKMVVGFKGGKSVEIGDVLVGEVWLCAGQSNMAQRIGNNAPRELADMPLVRQFAKGRGKDSANPPKWAAAVGENLDTMSITAIYFGENLFKELGVPVGLILTAVSGTPIESWIPKATLEADAPTKALLDKAADKAIRQKMNEARKKMKDDPSAKMEPDLLALTSLDNPGGLYSLHIEPTVPYAIRGAIWYQGEANSNAPDNAALYGKYLTLFVTSLRDAYKQPSLPLYIVQLPSIEEHRGGGEEPRVYQIVREQQRHFVQGTPHTGLAVSIDINEGLHPRHKNITGDRLAMLALAETYGKKPAGDYAGPLLKTVVFDGGRATCTFEHAGGGLALKNTDVGLFEIAGADGNFRPATAKVEGDKLIVECPGVGEAKAVRYAYKPSMPSVGLFGSTGLPASPFLFP